jgi:hypothetical protein
MYSSQTVVKLAPARPDGPPVETNAVRRKALQPEREIAGCGDAIDGR